MRLGSCGFHQQVILGLGSGRGVPSRPREVIQQPWNDAGQNGLLGHHCPAFVSPQEECRGQQRLEARQSTCTGLCEERKEIRRLEGSAKAVQNQQSKAPGSPG